MTNLPAVTTGGLGITPGTSSAPLSERTDRPAPITAFRTQELEAGADGHMAFFITGHRHTLHPSGQARPQSHEVRRSPVDTKCRCSTKAGCRP